MHRHAKSHRSMVARGFLVLASRAAKLLKNFPPETEK